METAEQTEAIQILFHSKFFIDKKALELWPTSARHSFSSVYSVDSPKIRVDSWLFVVPNQLFPNEFFPAWIEFQFDDGAFVLHRLDWQAADMEAFLSC